MTVSKGSFGAKILPKVAFENYIYVSMGVRYHSYLLIRIEYFCIEFKNFRNKLHLSADIDPRTDLAQG